MLEYLNIIEVLTVALWPAPFIVILAPELHHGHPINYEFGGPFKQLFTFIFLTHVY